MKLQPFKDHFSGHAADYARHRPGYPAELFASLAAAAPGRRLAWDCATGNGQAARGVARWFDHVVATDASPQQIAAAEPHERVEYRVEPAERTTLEPASCDLVTVAQALHWFDRPRFYAEVRRVARPRGVVAAWAYDLLRVTPEVDAILDALDSGPVGAYWPPERRHVDARYATLDFPFASVELPPRDMSHDWTAEACLDYLRTWSAVRRYVADRGGDPVGDVADRLRRAWGDGPRRVTWPLVVRAGRV